MARWTAKDQKQVSKLKRRAVRRGMRDTDAAEHAAAKVARGRGKGRSARDSAGLDARRPLEHRTVEELQLLARQRKIPGRSRMNRAELILALDRDMSR